MTDEEKQKLKKLADEAWEAIRTAYHYGDGFQDAFTSLEKRIQQAYELGNGEAP